LRGAKGSLWEGGTRVPFIVRWPAQVKPGTSAALMSQMDLLASLAALTGQAVPTGHATDSENYLAALLGTSTQGREYLVSQNNGPTLLGFRHGNWKLLPKGIGRSDGNSVALYNLADDLSETNNVAANHPEIVAAMTEKLNQIVGTPAEK
jgi:arylsulfatase A-like enzyme